MDHVCCTISPLSWCVDMSVASLAARCHKSLIILPARDATIPTAKHHHQTMKLTIFFLLLLVVLLFPLSTLALATSKSDQCELIKTMLKMHDALISLQGEYRWTMNLVRYDPLVTWARVENDEIVWGDPDRYAREVRIELDTNIETTTGRLDDLQKSRARYQKAWQDKKCDGMVGEWSPLQWMVEQYDTTVGQVRDAVCRAIAWSNLCPKSEQKRCRP